MIPMLIGPVSDRCNVLLCAWWGGVRALHHLHVQVLFSSLRSAYDMNDHCREHIHSPCGGPLVLRGSREEHMFLAVPYHAFVGARMHAIFADTCIILVSVYVWLHEVHGAKAPCMA